MTSVPATMRVVSTDAATQGPFVVINSADFDPAIHKPFDPEGIADPEAEPAIATQRRRGRPRKQPNMEA